MISLKITGGFDKNQKPEPIKNLLLESGKVYAIVGKTGSGKTQLIEDIESLSDGDGITRRQVTVLDGQPTTLKIAHLSQNMNFMMDLTVKSFINTRLQMLENTVCSFDEILASANRLCGEIIGENDLLTRLSGGQSRALWMLIGTFFKT